MVLDERRAEWFLAYQRGLLTRVQAFDCGLSPEGLRHRLRAGGPWQRLLPGVYLTATGTPTREQLLTAAVLYSGEPSVISGPAALRAYRVRVPASRPIDVLVPHDRQCGSRAFVVIHRTKRLPAPGMHDLAVRFAPPARAVADAVRTLSRRSDVRAVVASAVQQRHCSISELAAELAAGPRRGSALFRSVLAEVADGIRSPAEADFRDLIRKSGLPLPLFNPRLVLDGSLLAIPDAWWPDKGLAAEIDSREWHLSPDDWEATMRRDNRLRAAGIRVLHFSPHQVRTAPQAVLRDIAALLRTGEAVPGIVTVPASASGGQSASSLGSGCSNQAG